MCLHKLRQFQSGATNSARASSLLGSTERSPSHLELCGNLQAWGSLMPSSNPQHTPQTRSPWQGLRMGRSRPIDCSRFPVRLHDVANNR